MRGRRKGRKSGKQDEGYGLRKNPKKSWRSVAGLHQCEICGRTFESARAVFGHLRHHSGERRKIPVECRDSEGSGDEQKRARTMAQGPSLNRPSSVADETEKEVEDAAMTLMMISRGVRDWEGRSLKAAAGSCDNDLGSGNSVSECVLSSQSVEMKKLDCGVSVKVEDEHEESGYGVGSDEEEEEEEEEKGFWWESDKRSRKYKCRICQKRFASHQALGGHQTVHRMRNKVEMGNEGKEHQCSVCFKVFASGRALGGHSKCHKSLDIGATATGGEEPEVRLRSSMSCRDSGNNCKHEVLLTLAAN